jgi:DNA-binding FadR family transcriptional regulator
MTFKPKPVSRAREQVEAQIREAILSGVFKRGDRLPSEAELASEFSVSRTTVREALRALASSGLISKMPGATGGSFVQVIDYRSLGSLIADSIGNTLRLGSINYDEVAQVRRLLEIPSAGLAAVNRTESDVELLDRIISQEKGLTVEDPEVPPLDISFHSAVAEASKNRVLASFVSALHSAIEPVLAVNLTPEIGQTTVRQHEAIVNAIVDENTEAATNAMEEHLSYLQWLRKEQTATDR